LNEKLQLPTYGGDYVAIEDKITKKELEIVIDFVEKTRGKIPKEGIKKTIQEYFKLSDCSLSNE
jgi:hypothetical protein